MKPCPRLTFDPPADTVHAYRLTEFLNRREVEMPAPEVVRSSDNEVLMYCWDCWVRRRVPATREGR